MSATSTSLVQVTDLVGGAGGVLCRRDGIREVVAGWFPESDALVVDALERRDWAYLQIQVEDVADEDVSAAVWGELVVWPAIRETGRRWRTGEVSVSASGMSRVSPLLGEAPTVRVSGLDGQELVEQVTSWDRVREMIGEVTLTRALSVLAHQSKARRDADAAAEGARLAQRAAVQVALDAGATVYRCAGVSGLTQHGVRKMLASSPPRGGTPKIPAHP